MALTSVMTAYPAQQNTDLSNGTIGLQAFQTFQAGNIPHSKQMNLVNSTEASANLILSSVTPPHTPYFQSGSLPDAYFTTPNNATDPFQFIHPTLHALIHPYSSFRASPYPSSLTNGHSSRACLLPTPGPATGVESLALSDTGALGRNVVAGEVQYELGSVSDGTITSKRNTPSMENQLSHQNTIILIVRLLMSGKSGARINISDGSSPERIVTITGTTDQIFVAFSLMSQKFEDDFTQGLLRMGDDGLTCPPVTLRLLVPATQCGSIIGKGGSRIKDVRELTGASIQVASEALPTSTERTVTISGSAKAIAKCIRQLCDIFIENNTDNGYANCAPTHGMKQNSTVQISTEPSNPVPSSVGQSLTGTMGMPQHKLLALDGNTNTGFGTSADLTNPAGAMNPGRPNLVNELLADPTLISGAFSYPDFSNNQLGLLNAIHSNHLATSALPSPILNPIAPGFAFPDLTINPKLLGFYHPQSIGIQQPTGVDTDDTCDAQQPNTAFLSDVYTNNPVLSLVHSNGYLQSAGMLSPVSASPGPFLPNKPSILGLPAFPLQTALLNPNTSLPNCPEDSNVIKEIVLSNDLIGCIIGRGGTTVNEIRNISKAQVKISNCEDGAKDRKITLSGSPQAVNLAHFLIVNSIAAHQQMWSLNIQLASAATLLMTRSHFANEYVKCYNNVIPTLGQKEASSEAVSEYQVRNDASLYTYEQATDSSGSVPDTDLISTLTNTQVLQTKWSSEKSQETKKQIRSKVAPY
ncbi:Poly(rC)-binding protein 2 [Fasciola hepatica]|uniref:Poly(RC)-binding protein 2 n=1 Tax=Fasciola hepatica TaxID=6192 RepID=A0A4E0RX26_FASHE|nr:Poly(rC)-binding protein 2 [Fasciola hepatica]